MINSLEEAIERFEETAELNEECSRIYSEQDEVLASYACKECAEDHRQLAEWLRELKALKGNKKANPCDYCQEFDCCGCVYL